MLQFVFYPTTDQHQLVPVQHQLPQVALLPVWHPQARKSAFHHQLANVLCVPLVGLLLAHVTGPDLRRISDPDLVPQILHQFDEPLTVACRLHANQHRRCQCLIELLGVAAGMHQLLFPSFSRLRIQPIYLLPAGMEITPYNHHAKTPFFPASLVLKSRLPGESSLRSYPINPSWFSKGGNLGGWYQGLSQQWISTPLNEDESMTGRIKRSASVVPTRRK